MPEFHVDIFHLMTTTAVNKVACAIPRDHAKTTLAKLAALYHWLFTPYRFVIYVSATHSIAVNACLDIVGFLESENFIAVFGHIEKLIWRDGEGFYKFRIGDKLCILRALGARQQVRGINVDHQRPEVAIVDDLEDNDNIATEELRNALKRWFYGPFYKALDKMGNKLIQIGNMISNECLLKKHCEDPAWHSRRYGCILADGQPLWPDVWPLEKLQEDLNLYRRMGLIDVWFAEMMNLPMAAGRGLIRADEIYYQPEMFPEEAQYAFITVDPAISDKTWAHKCAIVVHAWRGDCWQIVEYVHETGIDPLRLFIDVVSLSRKWNVRTVGIEDVAYQASLKFVFEVWCMEKHVEGLEFVPLKAVARKVQRLAGWAAMIRSKQYAVTDGDLELIEQLLLYDPKQKENQDDLIDACSYGEQMIDLYIDRIMSEYSPRMNSARVMREVDIAEV